MAEDFDPLEMLRKLDEWRVGFVVIGDMAEVANGSPLGFAEAEVTFSLKDEHVDRLRSAIGELGGDPAAVDGIASGPPEASVTVETRLGRLRLTPTPAGTRGYEDVRRKSVRLHLARGLRVSVADVRDLIRIENAGEADRVRVATLQRIESLAASRGIGRER